MFSGLEYSWFTRLPPLQFLNDLYCRTNSHFCGRWSQESTIYMVVGCKKRPLVWSLVARSDHLCGRWLQNHEPHESFDLYSRITDVAVGRGWMSQEGETVEASESTHRRFCEGVCNGAFIKFVPSIVFKLFFFWLHSRHSKIDSSEIRLTWIISEFIFVLSIQAGRLGFLPKGELLAFTAPNTTWIGRCLEDVPENTEHFEVEWPDADEQALYVTFNPPLPSSNVHQASRGSLIGPIGSLLIAGRMDPVLYELLMEVGKGEFLAQQPATLGSVAFPLFYPDVAESPADTDEHQLRNLSAHLNNAQHHLCMVGPEKHSSIFSNLLKSLFTCLSTLRSIPVVVPHYWNTITMQFLTEFPVEPFHHLYRPAVFPY